MKKKKNSFIPRPVLKSLASDIKKLAGSNEGRLFLLEIIEEIPYDIRPGVLEGLSAFYDIEMVSFFYLLKWEYGKEVETICNRALEKYSLAGMKVDAPPIFEGEFYRAFASCSRHTGRITLDVAWKTTDKGVHVECFYLTFNPDGIHSFFLVETMSLRQYEDDRKSSLEMVELDYDEACFMVNQAYNFNIRHMSRPALGKFLYQKYLDKKVELSKEEELTLIRKTSLKLAPRQLVNCFFYALKYQDVPYMSSLFSNQRRNGSHVLAQFFDENKPDTILLEGEAGEVHGSLHTVRVNAYTLCLKNYEVFKNEYDFYLQRELGGNWFITDVHTIKRILVDDSVSSNPFNRQVFCRVYEIIDMDEVFEILDKIENIRELEELPGGMHMRVSEYEDDLNHGVSLLSGVVADLVLNGDEFVIISDEHDNVLGFHELLISNPQAPVICRGEYEISLLNACSYLGGQFVNFEDILLGQEELIFEDGMRLISARYLVKNSEKVLKRIEKLKNIHIELPGDYQVYYQFDDSCEEPGLFAEYILGPNWVTLSTFSDQDMTAARQSFEDKMYECLEFDGMELKAESIFDILTFEVKKEYPDLESVLKETYLNKWFNSHLATLSGMSPSEACRTEEGRRLLWAMFKKIKQKEKKRYLSGHKINLNLREYIRKVEEKKG
ncbi:MAG: hypothetical protein ABFD08_19690 [Syntrophomonas sp.]